MTKEKRSAPLDIPPEKFRMLGHRLIDNIADFLASIPSRRVTPARSPSEIRRLIGDGPLPLTGTSPELLLDETTKLLFDNSLFNGHPSFFGYITSSAAPIGALADLLASTINPNVGSFQLAPVATEIEAQAVRWIAEMTGYPVDCGGLLVSGGNMANFVCFLAGRKAKMPRDVRKEGLATGGRIRIYCSSEAHTWVSKAADLFGLGTDAIRWIPADEHLRMDPKRLKEQIEADRSRGERPLMVIGTAGSVSTGAIDPLKEISEICRLNDLWYHIDGAYGGFAAVLPDASEDLRSLHLADSVAVDPHKWLYAPLEAGCALVKNRRLLSDTFSYRPPYYKFSDDAGEQPTNFYEFGPQNSRGFRALKVWLALRQAGRDGYRQMIADDITLSEELYDAASKTHELEVFTHGLSITTFRYVPGDVDRNSPGAEKYLNDLNEELLTRIQKDGKAFLSNAVVRGSYVLRACIVNFRTTPGDVRALPELTVRVGKEVDRQLRAKLKTTSVPTQ
jgi:glutamate/tyrosine decarboxylase-like PLP-dependent enzyme